MSAPGKLKEYQMYIGGRFVGSSTGQTFESLNPYIGQSWAVRRRAPPRTSTTRCRRPAAPWTASGAG